VTSAASGLTAALAAGAVASAPTGLAASVATGALATTAATTSTTFAALKFMTMTKLKAGIISAVAVAGVATPLVMQHQAQVRLREKNQSLQQQIGQLTGETERLSNLLAQSNDAQTLAKDQLSELMRLRNEVGMLRRQTNELGKLREENRRLKSALADSGQDSKQSEFNPAFEQGMHIARVAKNVTLPLVLYASENQDQFPTDWDQAAPYFSKALSADPLFRNADDFIQAAKRFEIVYRGSRVGIPNPGSVILIRERQAWRTVDGKWVKAYGFADGSGTIHAEPEGNFDAWERQRMVSSASPGK
jgi:TolA-binding protein